MLKGRKLEYQEKTIIGGENCGRMGFEHINGFQWFIGQVSKVQPFLLKTFASSDIDASRPRIGLESQRVSLKSQV